METPTKRINKMNSKFAVPLSVAVPSRSSPKEQGNPIDFSTSDFSYIVSTPTFVDKTLLIKTIFAITRMVLITAPRRFGKSTNIDMLKKFLEIQVYENGMPIEDIKSTRNYNIFKDNNLKIFQDKTFFDAHFSKYPVIHASFKCVGGNSFEDVLDTFRAVLHYTFKHHSYLLNNGNLWLCEDEFSATKCNKNTFIKYWDTEKYKNLTKTEVEVGLKFLSEILYKHFGKKAFVLIDEYDAPINNTMFESTIDVEQVNKFVSFIFSNTLKENKFVDHALLTGISYFATVSLSGANNIEKYMFLGDHKFVEFYGLTIDEVDQLLKKFRFTETVAMEVKLHYNGYLSIREMSDEIYSIWSILHFLENRRIDSYWEKSGIMVQSEKALKLPIIRYAIEKLIQGDILNCKILARLELKQLAELRELVLQAETPKKQILKNPDIYLSFLLQQGYLTFTEVISKDLYKIKIPNNQIKSEFADQLETYYESYFGSHIENIARCSDMINLISATATLKYFRKLIVELKNIFESLDTKMFTQNEDVYHSVIFSILCKSHFKIGTEARCHNGRIDLLFYSENLAVVMEVKYAHKNTSKAGLKQIVDQKYTNIFKNKKLPQKIDYILIGLNVSEDIDVSISYLINSENLKEAVHVNNSK